MKPCSLHPGRIGSHGYGVLPGEVLAHRQAYADAHGVSLSALKGLTVRHSCDVRACREPAHLTTGTHLDNMRDMRERGRSNRGERHGSAKLTRAQVNKARREHVPGSRTHGAAALAARYGISRTQMRRILKGQRWQTGTKSLSH